MSGLTALQSHGIILLIIVLVALLCYIAKSLLGSDNNTSGTSAHEDTLDSTPHPSSDAPDTHRTPERLYDWSVDGI